MTDWQRRINRPGDPAVPILIAGMHRVFWVPRRYATVAAATLDGRAFTLRQMAARTGYSVKGLWAALRSMDRLGIGILRTTRGWMGRTRMRIQEDVSRANVSTTDVLREGRSSLVGNPIRTVVETFTWTL